MSGSFAAIEARMTRAVIDRLSNAVATLPGGAVVSVIFDAAFSAPFGQAVETTQPVFVARTEDVSALVQGDDVVLASVTYTVERVEPDGTGMSRVTLYKA